LLIVGNNTNLLSQQVLAASKKTTVAVAQWLHLLKAIAAISMTLWALVASLIK